jgi:hypothetical protein
VPALCPGPVQSGDLHAWRDLSQLLHPHRLAPLARTRACVPVHVWCAAHMHVQPPSLAPPRHGFYFQRVLPYIHGYSGFITASIHHFLMKLHMESTSKLWLALSNPFVPIPYENTCVYIRGEQEPILLNSTHLTICIPLLTYVYSLMRRTISCPFLLDLYRHIISN